MKISLVIPAYNEQEILGRTIATYLKFLKQNFAEFELIVVDDGSKDKTADIIRSFPECICISYKTNRGKGYAVKRGFLRATGDYIFFTDADLSYSPGNILRALSLFKQQNVCGVVGVRNNKRSGYPPLRRFFSVCFQKIVLQLLKTDIPDTQCGFKAFDKQTAKMIFSQSEICGFGFDFEIIYIARMMQKKLLPLPVTFIHRASSRINILSDSRKMLKSLLRLKFKRSLNNVNF
ncbi:MAG: glycosyltransferase [Clostridia bacterium]|nr:glycosyltransferase [Clostridia bacterium]